MNVRLTDDPVELKTLEQLQLDVWGADPVPSHQLIAAARNGGCVFVAELEQEIVGFCYGFSAGDYLVSHLLAVHPKARRRGLGAALKRVQWEWARDEGFAELSWTFDPLRMANARLNLAELGATAARYYVNYYGSMHDGLNAGGDTDRLEIRWPTQKMPETERGEVRPLLVNDRVQVPEAGGWVSIPIPEKYPESTEKNSRLSLLREAFQWAFEHGYRAVDFDSQGYILRPWLTEK